MTKKNIQPQQVAPVQRQTAAHSSLGEKGCQCSSIPFNPVIPFAGDDGE